MVGKWLGKCCTKGVFQWEDFDKKNGGIPTPLNNLSPSLGMMQFLNANIAYVPSLQTDVLKCVV